MDDRTNIEKSEDLIKKALEPKQDRLMLTLKVYESIGTGPNDRGSSAF